MITKFKILILVLVYQGVHSQATIKIKNKTYFKGEGIIFTEQYIPNFYLEEPGKLFTPNFDEISKAEMILQNKYNLDVKTPKIKNIRKEFYKFNRQYIGYINASGNKIIIINLLHLKCKKEFDKYFIDWEENFIVGFGAYYEKNTKGFIIDLENNNLKRL